MTRIPMIACIAISAIAATAQAQPSPAPLRAAEVDAQNRADDISTVNGQLVEVGTQNRYRYSYKQWNVSANPLGVVFGFYGASLSYALSSNFAIRGDISYHSPVGSSLTGFEVGVGAPIYFRKMYSGMFVEPGVISRTSSWGGESTNTVGPQVLLGYHWYWDSGLNTAIALGAGRNWNSRDGGYGDDELFFNGYLRVGYAF